MWATENGIIGSKYEYSHASLSTDSLRVTRTVLNAKDSILIIRETRREFDVRRVDLATSTLSWAIEFSKGRANGDRLVSSSC
jgi:hypothetical protein